MLNSDTFLVVGSDGLPGTSLVQVLKADGIKGDKIYPFSLVFIDRISQNKTEYIKVVYEL